jgi:Holliday junction resolvasome RuvABC endonuclease subunit
MTIMETPALAGAEVGEALASAGPRPRVLGVDPSLTCTGLAGDGWTDAIKPAAKLRGHQRLAFILDRLADFTRHADLVVIEGPAYGSQARERQQGQHERGGLWWLITHSLWVRCTPLAVVPPNKLKQYATGKGVASKDDVIREVVRRFDWFTGDNNQADALALAAMGFDWLGHPMVAMPAKHRAALDGCDWPDLSAAVAA